MKFVMATLCNGTGTDFGLQCTQLWLTIVHSQLLAVLVVGCETELLSCVSVFGDEDSPSTD